tara:strand:- start:1426 stop:1869 length:444 start_codon:yes stop_codon:yes gene_type:complete
MDLKQIHAMWNEDCVIHDMKLDEASREAPLLHSKYLELLSHTKLKLKRAEAQQKILLKDKWLYYNGKMSEEDLKTKGWNPDPFNGLKILKGEMDYYYDSDPEIQKSEERIEYYKTSIDVLKEILSNITWRHQTVKNMIEWKKFQSGN